MRILFLAWGSGNGHIVRIGALARAAARAGHEPLVCSTAAEHLVLLRKHGLDGSVYPGEQTSRGHWSQWHDPDYVRRCIDSDEAAMRAMSAELVVHDGRPSTGEAAGRLDIPVTGVLQSIHLPGHQYFGREPEAIWKTMADAFNQISAFGPYTDGREAIALGGVALPSIPQIDPVPDWFADRVAYVGPLTAVDPPQALPERRYVVRSQTLLYKVLPSDLDYDEFLAAFADLSDRIVIATGGLRAPKALARQFECVELVPSAQIADFRSAVIHAGHGTSLLMLQLGVPFVALPGGSPERQQNARNLQALGVASTLGHGGGSWELHDHPNGLVDWPQVRRQLDAIHATPQVASNANDWRLRLADSSPRRALDAVVRESSVPGRSPGILSRPARAWVSTPPDARDCQIDGVGHGYIVSGCGRTAFEGGVEGVAGPLPALGPAGAAFPGGVEGHDGEVDALEGGLLVREVPAGP